MASLAGTPRGSTPALTLAALASFAGNSLLCRAALARPTIDAATFSLVRIGAGALVLAAIVRVRDARGASASTRAAPSQRPSLLPSVALVGYAFAFSDAYVRLTAGTGALILFGVVQLTMVASGLRSGERPRPLAWFGIALAFGGLVALTLPGLAAPSMRGAAMMAVAGVCWGVYTLRGRGAADPLAMTARNFGWGAPLAAALWLAVVASVRAQPSDVSTLVSPHASARGIALAVASGAVASGVGYSLWYAALRGLTTTRAAVVQLAVPVLAAVGAVALLGEPISLRLALAGVAILGGVATVLRAR